MSNDDKSLSHTRWNCKYHLLFTPKSNLWGVNEQHGNLKYKYVNGNFWSKGYYANTVGLNSKTIQKYIREQEADDRVRDSIRDPFKK